MPPNRTMAERNDLRRSTAGRQGNDAGKSQ
jgi:hypothetical protein